MKLGGSIVGPYQTPEEWGKLLKGSRFAAVTSPISHAAPKELAQAYLDEAKRLSVTIAEVGVWKNPLAPDEAERKAALAFAQAQLAFADEIGANCCVNIVGSRGERWDGAYPDNYAPETYDAIVQSVREIIDAVKPTRTFYTIEPMPWMVPDGPDEYLQLLKDVDRPAFGVHLDFVNMINSPRRYLAAEAFIEECFKKLAPYTKSIHAKDSIMEQPFTTMIREVAPGKGVLDYAKVLRAANAAMPKEIPFLLEHMNTDQEYAESYQYVADIADKEGIEIR
ncbi:sugar phosphate isomerase/epimerase [Eubacteriales bacterium OttesenSCG-928-N13]|nr:sugar phosphate isomerase/epimerase [Eubacteriales bacterium OttesenSCG-928-N13]